MDPLDHNHLMAGSKMYENNEKYLFKVGTYESFDGGRTWKDLGHLPGYCEAPGQCDPSNEVTYRTTSDPTIDFDDEGNVYINVLDAPGGTNAFQGFNMTVHVKRPGQDWSGPTVVHDNRVNALTTQLFLDDKNWIAVDNHTDVNGGGERAARRQDRHDVHLLELRRHRHRPAAADRRHALARRRQDVGRHHARRQPAVPGQPEDAHLGDRLPHRDRAQGRGLRDVVRQPAQRAHAGEVQNRGALWTLAVPIAGIAGVNEPFLGEAFRNLSIPTTAVDGNGTVYVAVASRNAQGNPLLGNLLALGKQIKSGGISVKGLQDLLVSKKANNLAGKDYKAGGDGLGPMSGSDIVLFKSTNGGRSYTGPVRVNQDPRNGDADQFQPWMAVTRERPDQHLVLRSPQRPGELLHRHVARALGGRRADVHRPARLVAHVGSRRQRADVGLGQVHRRLPGPRRRRRRGDPVLERHAAQQPAKATRALALPGGLRGARAQRRRGGDERTRCVAARAEGRPALDRPPVAALDARGGRPPARPARADRARRAALLRQGRRQRARGVHEEGSRRLRGDDREGPQAPGHRSRKLAAGAAAQVRQAPADHRPASTACGPRAPSTCCSGRGAGRSRSSRSPTGTSSCAAPPCAPSCAGPR